MALQLGGSDPAKLAEAAAIGEGFGYDEINLNVGCPSDRVQEGRFGACLMAEPELVARCVAAMRRAVRVPVTVKCRIGIDDQDSEADLERFVSARLPHAGCRTFIVHARKAWLQGPVAQGEPRDPAARLRPRLSPEGGASRSGDRHQRRHRHAWRRPRRTSPMWTAWRSAARPTRTPICWPRSTAACSAPPRPPPSRASGDRSAGPLRRAAPAQPADGSTTSPGTFWASTTAGRAPAPFAATSPNRHRAPGLASTCCSRRWRSPRAKAPAPAAGQQPQ